MEAAIRRLRGVNHAVVVLDASDKIVEIHIDSSSDRPAKQIVRDVQTVLLTRFHKTFDRRVVSVAPMGREAVHPGPGAIPETERLVSAGSVGSAGRAAIVNAADDGPRARRAADRIRFVSVNLYVSGPRAQAQVELRWKGITRMGSASGTATRDSAHLLVAGATVSALEEFLEEDWSLGVNGVKFVNLGPDEAVVVGLTLLAHRREKTLAGCCTVEQDVPQAVALATLAALNRVVGGLETREPIEYVLRPTSNQEASEAKNA